MRPCVDPVSERLSYTRLAEANLAQFHALCLDPHVRRFLLDGDEVDEGWVRGALGASEALFASQQVGLWLLGCGPTVVGFAGFFVFESLGPEPQLLYALTQAHSGMGYATEAGQACVALAERLGWTAIHAAVDEPNTASVRVLRKLGFDQSHTCPGGFGRTLCFVRHRRQTDAPGLGTTLPLTAVEGSAQRETFESLVSREGVRLERIVSTGQSTPPGVWYEQDEHEWVLVMEGAARLEFGDGTTRELSAGDALLLPARCKHRVDWTDPGASTVWLAVFFR